jgi:hypothetical protein
MAAVVALPDEVVLALARLCHERKPEPLKVRQAVVTERHCICKCPSDAWRPRTHRTRVNARRLSKSPASSGGGRPS